MQLKTLGGLTLEGSSFTRAKPLLLLAYLALEGAKERRYLAELFWRSSSDPRNNLGTAIAHLKKGVPGVLGADNFSAWCEATCDAKELLDAVDSNEPARVVELYRGAFLAGVDTEKLGVELEEWVYGTREYLAGQARWASLSLAEEAAARGEFREAAKHTERGFFLQEARPPEPEDWERSYVLLMAGESARASQLREEAREYDLDFDVTTKEAIERLGGSFPVDDRATPHDLPRSVTSFVGRDRELLELTRLLSEPDCRLLTLMGPGGVGKSRLAVKLAWDLLESEAFEDGIYFVPLDSLASSTAIPSHIALSVGMELQGGEDPMVRVARFLGEKRILLVLDNFEHLVAGAGIVSDLVRSCPHLRVLVTSRERLNISEESAYPVEGFAVPSGDDATLIEMAYRDALELFVQRAKRADIRFVMTREVMPDVVRVCRVVQGMPLGIELAAVWVKIMLVGEIAQEIERSFGFLESPLRDASKRHRSVRAVFEHSWGLLDPQEQAILRGLSVFRGGFTRAAASEVVGASIPVLASLVDKSLLRVQPNRRYDQHPLLLQFTMERLAEDPEERTDVEARHAQYFFRFLHHQANRLRSREEARALHDIGLELDNVRKAWGWAVRHHKVEELESTAETIRVFFDRRGTPRDSLEILEAAISELDEERPVERKALGYLFAEAVIPAWRVGRASEARAYAERSLAIHRSLHEKRGMTRALMDFGVLLALTGRYREAYPPLEEALVLSRELNDPVMLGIAMGHLADVEAWLGLYQQADPHYREALEYLRSAGAAANIAYILAKSGVDKVLAGEFDEATALVEEGLELMRTSPNLSLEGLYNIILGDVAYGWRDHQRAEARYREALEIADEGGDYWLKTWGWSCLGRLAVERGDLEQGELLLKESLSLSTRVGDRIVVAITLAHVAELAVARGARDQAEAILEHVVRYPGTQQRVRDRADSMLRKIRERHPRAAAAGSEEPAEAVELGEVVALALAYLS